MNEQDRDNLLIRLDERTAELQKKAEKIDKIIDVVGNLKADVKFIKQVGSAVATIGGLVIGALEYFKS